MPCALELVAGGGLEVFGVLDGAMVVWASGSFVVGTCAAAVVGSGMGGSCAGGSCAGGSCAGFTTVRVLVGPVGMTTVTLLPGATDLTTVTLLGSTGTSTVVAPAKGVAGQVTSTVLTYVRQTLSSTFSLRGTRFAAAEATRENKTAAAVFIVLVLGMCMQVCQMGQGAREGEFARCAPSILEQEGRRRSVNVKNVDCEKEGADDKRIFDDVMSLQKNARVTTIAYQAEAMVFVHHCN